MRQPTSHRAGATADAVFVDRTGRRRRVFTILGLGVGAVLLAAVALLVAGLTGTAPVTLPGLPVREHAVMRGEVGPVASTASPAPKRSSRSATSPPDSPAVAAGPSNPRPAATVTSSPPAVTHGNRPSTHPGHPKPTRTK